MNPSDHAKHALGWLHTARFLTTAPQLHHLPAYELPEIAFVGRSNAGKSTCINVLTQQKRLAYASKTPGRTQNINLFALGRQGQADALEVWQVREKLLTSENEALDAMAQAVNARGALELELGGKLEEIK